MAGALRLSPAERLHLFRLAGTTAPPPAGPVRAVRPSVAALLHRMPDTAAIVTDASYDVIAANPLARRLFCDLWPSECDSAPTPPARAATQRANTAPKPNLARRRFLQGGGMVSSKTQEFGLIAVARLRAAASRYPHDPALAALLGELRGGSPEFAQMWAADPVHTPGHRSKTLEHPRLGTLRISCDVLTVPDEDQQVVFVTAEPGSASARALRSLAASDLAA